MPFPSKGEVDAISPFARTPYLCTSWTPSPPLRIATPRVKSLILMGGRLRLLFWAEGSACELPLMAPGEGCRCLTDQCSVWRGVSQEHHFPLAGRSLELNQ